MTDLPYGIIDYGSLHSTLDSKKLLKKCQKQDLIDIKVIVLIGKGKTCLSTSVTARLVAT